MRRRWRAEACRLVDEVAGGLGGVWSVRFMRWASWVVGVLGVKCLGFRGLVGGVSKLIFEVVKLPAMEVMVVVVMSLGR